ncbi:MAG: hypothetical protein ACFHWZ_01305 [Phycisphaerales bacterium]
MSKFDMLTAWKNIAGITIGLELATMRTGIFLEPQGSVATLLTDLAEQQDEAAAATGMVAAVVWVAQVAFGATALTETVFAAAALQHESPLVHSAFSTFEACTTSAFAALSEQHDDLATVLAATTLAVVLSEQQPSFSTFAASTTLASLLQQESPFAHSVFSTLEAATTFASLFDEQHESPFTTFAAATTFASAFLSAQHDEASEHSEAFTTFAASTTLASAFLLDRAEIAAALRVRLRLGVRSLDDLGVGLVTAGTGKGAVAAREHEARGRDGTHTAQGHQG